MTDTEPLYFMLRGEWPIHRSFHTFLGAAFVALLTVGVGASLIWLSRRISLPNVFGWQQLGYPAMLCGAFLGTYSHIILDSMTHIDMQPLAPLSHANPMLGWLNYRQVQVLCVALALLGAAVLYLRAKRDEQRAL